MHKRAGGKIVHVLCFSCALGPKVLHSVRSMFLERIGADRRVDCYFGLVLRKAPWNDSSQACGLGM
eukprot:88118-Amphidinium_carterae.1